MDAAEVTGAPPRGEAVLDTSAGTIPDYEAYDFSSVWKGRKIEDDAEKMLMLRFAAGGGDGNYLDLGGGFGRITQTLEPLFQKVFMIDYSKRNLRSASTRLRSTAVLVRCALGGLPFEDDTFDFISMVRVMHHIREPSGLLAEVARVGRDRATFVMSVPNPATRRALRSPTWPFLGPQGHTSYPTEMGRYGNPLLRLEEIRGVGAFDNRAGVVFQRLAPLSNLDERTSRLWPAKAQLFLRFSVRKAGRIETDPAVLCGCGGRIVGSRCDRCSRSYGRTIDLVDAVSSADLRST